MTETNNSLIPKFGFDFVEVLVDSIYLPPQCTLPARGSLSVWMAIGNHCTRTRELQNVHKKILKNRQLSVRETLYINTARMQNDFNSRKRYKIYLKLKICMYVSNVHKTLGSERIELLQNESFPSDESRPNAITYPRVVEVAGLNGLEVRLQIRIHNPQHLFYHSFMRQNTEHQSCSSESLSEQERTEHDVPTKPHCTGTGSVSTTASAMQQLPSDKLRRFSIASSASTASPSEVSPSIPAIVEVVAVPPEHACNTSTVPVNSVLSISTCSPLTNLKQQLSPVSRQLELQRELKVCKGQLAQLSSLRVKEQEQRQQGRAAVEAHVNTVLLQNAQLRSENTYLLSCLIETKMELATAKQQLDDTRQHQRRL